MRGPHRRAQTGIDFLVGMGVFLLTIGLVVGFVPGMFAPFTGDQERPLVADRTADALAGDMLVGPEPAVLDEACTVAFFGIDNGADCPFDETAPLAQRVALPGQYDLHVTLERDVTGGPDREVLCGTTEDVVACSDPTDPRLEAGEPVPEGSATVVTASRVVTDGQREALVVVRVW